MVAFQSPWQSAVKSISVATADVGPHAEHTCVQFMARNGFYIIIDNHFEDTTIITNPTGWVNNWSGMMADIVKDSVSAGRVLVDLFNEPDSKGLTWSTVCPSCVIQDCPAQDAHHMPAGAGMYCPQDITHKA